MTITTDTSSLTGISATRALLVGSAALFTDMLVHGLAVPVLPLLSAVTEAGPAATGVLFSAYAVAMIVATLFAGRMVDRYGPKMPLLAGLAGLGVATLLFASGGPFALLLAARLAQGIAGGLSWVAALSLIAASTPLEQRGQSMGIALSTVTLGVLVGPPLAGFFVEHFGPASPFIFAAGVAFLDGVLRVKLVKDSRWISDDRGGALAVLRVSGSLSISLAIAVGAGVLSGVEPVLPVHLGETPLTVGLLFALAALSSIIANPFVGRCLTGVPVRILAGIGVVAVVAALLVIGFAVSLWQTSLGMILLGVSAALLLTPATTLISEQGFRASPPTLGGSFALYNLAYAAGLAGGPLLTGVGVQQAGFTAGMVLAAAALALIGASSLVQMPSRISAVSRSSPQP